MFGYLTKKIFRTKNDRIPRRLRPLIDQINRFELEMQKESDVSLKQRTTAWKERLSKIEDMGEVEKYLDEILPEAFAVVKNVCRRLMGKEIIVRGHPTQWDMIPFDVQLVGGICLHSGKISEMATGEGKTLVATLPVYLNALTGRGVHVVTVNDYLAARDSEWMGAIYKFLGLTVGCIVNDQEPQIRKAQYACDVTYGTNSEFGFDYLRDNGMALRAEDQVQRGRYFAIIDEVDSILIDEARTPLIISGPALTNVDNSIYEEFRPAMENLVQAQNRLCNRFLDEANKVLKKLHSEDGSQVPKREALEKELGLWFYKTRLGAPKNPNLLRYLENPENLRLMNQAELELHADQSKQMLYAQKEELLFAIKEQSHDADLTEKGRNFLSPKDPDAFVMPDLTTAYHVIDTGPEKDTRRRIEAKAKLQADFEARSQKIHCISQLLKAYCLYERDVEYVVQNNKVIIVDEHTGRLMAGRRWSDGLHQAVEAKERVEIEKETQTLATITIQNYFRLYHKLAGMTGTAETEAQEFFDIYKLGLLVIPTNKPCVRKDDSDSVYKTKREKFGAVVSEVVEIHKQGRPILVGTVSVEASEHLSQLLKRVGIVHSVLNAKQHEREAEIIARAGQRGSVTIATNMAGRGTDIKLGAGVPDIGGLHVLGTERHEARRIDRQLRGRCARQGDPGTSHFFISLEDDLMRLFSSDRLNKVMEKAGLVEGQKLTHPLLNRSVESAQKRVEQHNYEIRKRTLEYDDVMNKQREVIYGFRHEIIHATDVRDRLMDVMQEVVVQKVISFTTGSAEARDWNLSALLDWVNFNFPLGLEAKAVCKIANQAHENPLPNSLFDGLTPAQYAVATYIIKGVRDAYELKASFEESDVIKTIERYSILQAIDRLRQEHLYFMDSLRNAIGLRAYGQKDPLIEYKAEAFKTFEELMQNIKTAICHNIFRSASSLMAFEKFLRKLPQNMVHQDTNAFANQSTDQNTKAGNVAVEAAEAAAKTKPLRLAPKVGRNNLCPCGSGKKFKQCCGR